MKDIFRYILPKHLDYIDLLNLSVSNKNMYEFMKEELVKKRIVKQKRVKELFDEDTIDMVGKNRLLLGKEIPWDNKYLGDTDYIERVNYSDFENDNNCIFFGKDLYDRTFMFVKVRTLNNKSLLIIFQRYTGLKMFICLDENNSTTFIRAKRVVSGDVYHKLQEMFSGKNEKLKVSI